MAMHDVFEHLSHFTYKGECENSTIRKIRKGEEYVTFLPNDSVIQEDAKYKSWIRMALHGFPYVAREDRWYSGDGVRCRTVDEVIEDWDGHVTYRESEDKFYNKSWVVLHYIDGCKRTKYFDTEAEMAEFVETVKAAMDCPTEMEFD